MRAGIRDGGFALLEQLARRNQAALAVAVTPPPKPGDADGFLGLAKLMVKKGDDTGAVKAALEAAQIWKNTADSPRRTGALGAVIGVLDELGAYDAAMATAQAIPPLNGNQFFVKTIEAAITRKDFASVKRLLPVAVTALNTPTPDGKIQTMFLAALAQRLAETGHVDEARPIYQQLSDLVHAAAPSPNRLPLGQFAVLTAAMGDLAGALQIANDAGPLVGKPSEWQVMTLAAMMFDNPSQRPTPDQTRVNLPSASMSMERAARSSPALPCCLRPTIRSTSWFLPRLVLTQEPSIWL